MEYKDEENDYLLCDSNTWVSESVFTISYLPLVERYLVSNLQVEVIKLEVMEQATIENTNILTTAVIVNERRISSSLILKQNDGVGRYYGKSELTIDCKQEEVANSSENYSVSVKGAHLSHSGKKPFYCDICEKEFKRRCNLNTHKLIHSGEKPYTCDTCEKAFNRRSNLNAHKLIHSR